MVFNVKAKAKNTVVNHEGAKAYKLTAPMELYTAVVTASLSDTFYEKGNERLERIQKLIAQNDPAFVAKLAVYAREKMYLRSIPLVLTVELAKIHRGDNLVGRLVSRVVQRADEITELLSYYSTVNERPGVKKLAGLSKQVQRGLAHAFNKFDEYQFAKYNSDAAITLRDALFLTHPIAKNDVQQAIFNKIVTRSLATPYTWETELSALGQQKFENETQKAAAFQAKWEELIDSGKLGYMALLRNLRNILQANVSAAHIEKVCARLADANEVARSKQFPFRFLSAYRELINETPDTMRVKSYAMKFGHISPLSSSSQVLKTAISPSGYPPSVLATLEGLKTGITSGYTPSVLAALEDAIKASVVNMRGFGYTTNVTVACDVSSSMQQPISAKSSILLYDIGLLLGMLLQSKCKNVEAGMFGDRWKTIAMPSNQVLSNVQEFYRREGEVGYSTNGYLVIQDLLKRQVVKDKVMLFTDVQMWNSTGGKEHIGNLWLEYRKTIAPNAKLYLFDLAGHGTTPLDLAHAHNGVYLIAGWSDKIFDVLTALEDGDDALKMINDIEL
jgi:60 kDa SS-A/Ro ribonucleoprotein